MNNAPTPDGRGQERPHDAEPFFPSEGSFNPVVPLSEIGHAPAALPAFDPADAGKPAEAAWAREAHRAKLKEEEETLVPSRAGRTRGRRPSWLVPASVIALSVMAGLASGSYLIWSSQRAQEAQPPARVANEAPAPPPVEQQEAAAAKVERVSEPARDEKPAEVAKAAKPAEAAREPKQTPPPLQPAPRAERVARAAAEAKEVAPAPKPARTQNAPTPRPRVTTAETHPPARTPPISSPPPSAKSKKVIQWP
ncbi:MAG: hypothetical protein JOZ02_21035 [Acidobacteria bacterium]|nr:hypothetical protein [Acidobacteriota bacterium]